MMKLEVRNRMGIQKGRVIVSLCTFVGMMALSSCLSSSQLTGGTLASSVTGPFTGAQSAANLDGTRIRISWNASTGGVSLTDSNPVASYHVYEYSQLTGSLNPIAITSSSTTSYIVTGVTPGTFHSYVVQAFDASGTSDGNTNTVSAIAYAGINSVTQTGTSTALATFPTASAATQFDIYCSYNGGPYTLVATAAPTATTAPISGLNSGTIYTCKVLAVSPAGAEDQNTQTSQTQTTSLSSTQYQGVILVQAAGPAPGAPALPPSSAAQNLQGSIFGPSSSPAVSITWKAFSQIGPQGFVYTLVRTGKGNPIDMSTTTPCTSSITTSCQVVCNTSTSGYTNLTYANGSGSATSNVTCQDLNVAPAPQQYDYAVTRIVNGVPEQLPPAQLSPFVPATQVASTQDAPYRITVAIPPTNMVLVHRDSVNYEMCVNLLGKTPNPLNHQACSYSGLGAIPTNSGSSVFPNAPIKNPAGVTQTGVYDFGYNLFVDRWTAACNYTMSGALGGATPTGGSDGSVFYDTTSGNNNCWVNVEGTWQNVGSASIPSNYLAKLYTITPNTTSRRPPLTTSQPTAYSTCQSISDPSGFYGTKRLLRRREFVAAAAWTNLSIGDPNGLSDPGISSIQYSTSLTHPAAYLCNSNDHTGVTSPTTFGVGIGSGVALTMSSELTLTSEFTIGSTGTSACLSRYGAQDMVGNVFNLVSDQYANCSSTTHTCTGQTSTLDSGNTDMANYSFNGSTGPGGVAGDILDWNLAGPAYNANYFNAPLGLPMMNASDGLGSNDTLLIGGGTGSNGIPTTKLHNDGFLYSPDWINAPTSVATLMSGGAAGYYNYGPAAILGYFNGRFGTQAAYVANSDYYYGANVGFHCAMPAE